MSGITKKRKKRLKVIPAAVFTAAVLCALYYSGIFLPGWAVWHDAVIECDGDDEPDEIVLKGRRVTVSKGDECIFVSPRMCKVQNILYTDIDRDGEKELVMLNFNIRRYGKHRPFWVKHDALVWRQHIYIYDYEPAREIFRPIWMASDIGMEASDMEMEDKQVIRLTDSHGVQTRWMWISFGLRCVD